MNSGHGGIFCEKRDTTLCYAMLESNDNNDNQKIVEK